MLQAALLNAWPLAVALIFTCGAMAALVRIAATTFSFQLSTFDLHRDQRGSVQSLSFVLTVPVFVMLMLLSVQITQLMIGQIIVHYAAFAAARSAAVWIPARVEQPLELANWINVRQLTGGNANADTAMMSPKMVQIHRAAALACVPIAPSRDLGLADLNDTMTKAIVSTFSAYSSSAQTNSRIPQRLANKWAYALRATQVGVSTFHRRFGTVNSAYQDEPPLWDSNPLDVEAYYWPTEIGWRDEITVTVTHNFALLPGPGRLLARRANESQQLDTVSRSIFQSAGVYYVPLSANATIVPEGEKSVAPFVNQPLWP